jgi:hypothetical protein
MAANSLCLNIQYLYLSNTKCHSQFISTPQGPGWSQGSSVGIVTGYSLDGLGLIPGSAKFFSSSQHPD